CEHCKDDHACRRVFHGIGLLSLLHCDCEWALNCSANGWCTLLVTCFHGLDRRCRLLLQNEAALTMREARLFVSVISIWPGCGCFMVSCGWLSTNFKAGQPHHEFLQPLRRACRAAHPRGRQPAALGMRKLQHHSLRESTHDRGLCVRMGK